MKRRSDEKLARVIVTVVVRVDVEEGDWVENCDCQGMLKLKRGCLSTARVSYYLLSVILPLTYHVEDPGHLRWRCKAKWWKGLCIRFRQLKRECHRRVFTLAEWRRQESRPQPGAISSNLAFEHDWIAWPFKVANSELSGPNCWWHVWETDPHPAFKRLQLYIALHECLLSFRTIRQQLKLRRVDTWSTPIISVQHSATIIALRLVNPEDARDLKNSYNGHHAFLILHRGIPYHRASQNRYIEAFGSRKQNQSCATCGRFERSTIFSGSSAPIAHRVEAWRWGEADRQGGRDVGARVEEVVMVSNLMICVRPTHFRYWLDYPNLLIHLVLSQSIAMRVAHSVTVHVLPRNTCGIIRAQEGIAVMVKEERRRGFDCKDARWDYCTIEWLAWC